MFLLIKIKFKSNKMRPEDFRQAKELYPQIESFEEAIKNGQKFTHVKNIDQDIKIEISSLEGDEYEKFNFIIKKEYAQEVNNFLLEKYKSHLEKLKEKFNQI